MAQAETREKVVNSRLDKVETNTGHMQRQIEASHEETKKAILEEMREREEKRCNIIMHNVKEAEEGDREAEKVWDRRSFDKAAEIMGLPLRYETAAVYARRLGLRRPNQERPRPLLIGLASEQDKIRILGSAKRLKDTDFDTVTIVPDLTQEQRDSDKALRDLAARKNRTELTPEDLAKNLRWVAVGKKGSRRLVKMVSRDQHSHPHSNHNSSNSHDNDRRKGKKRAREEIPKNDGKRRKDQRITNTEEESTAEEEEEDSNNHNMEEEEESEEERPGTSHSTA